PNDGVDLMNVLFLVPPAALLSTSTTIRKEGITHDHKCGPRPRCCTAASRPAGPTTDRCPRLLLLLHQKHHQAALHWQNDRAQRGKVWGPPGHLLSGCQNHLSGVQ